MPLAVSVAADAGCARFESEGLMDICSKRMVMY
jgi:hypothetical protein